MRRLLLVPALFAIVLAAAACAASTGPGWTYAPPTVPPPSQPAASSEASAAPSAAPASAAPSDGGSGGGGDVVQISAFNIAFEQSEVSAPAGTPFTIHFNNKDASGTQVFKGDVVTGPAETDYSVPALPAGTYQFVCTIHPNMVGTLTVGG
jgi:plastocyanin